ncbi:MAG TPA: HAD family phosphatase [Oceanithermus profundus]|uniref:HAD family phosphatase n=1 Tax=Oceanithermus profundus TaxID=187137 RepID=A0A7C4VF21_9DEIN|nr:HAD family phosphatase [Oceanithermus profundus]
MARALVTVDLDGTLLKRGVFLPEAERFLQRLRKAGHLLAVNTGRLPAGFALEAARRVDPQGLHLFSDGALLSDSLGRIREGASLSPATARRALRMIRRLGLSAELHTLRGTRHYLPGHAPEDLDEHVARTGTPIFPAAAERLERTRLVAVWLVGLTPEDWSEVRREPLGLVRVETYGSPEGPVFVGVKPRDRHKGTGLRSLARFHELPLEATVMVGDGLNDVGGLEAAGLGIAVGNGDEAALRAADRVVAPADAGGLEEAADLILQTFGRA